MATDFGKELKMKMRMVVSKTTYESMLVMEESQTQHATAQQTQTQQYKNKRELVLCRVIAKD